MAPLRRLQLQTHEATVRGRRSDRFEHRRAKRAAYGEGDLVARPSSLLEIVEFWRAMPLGKPPFIHPEDLPAMQHHAAELLAEPAANFSQFLASKRFGDLSDHRFHFSLLPIPYLGDLNRADIFVLQLNPGFNLNNYYAEWNVPAFRRRVERNVRQELDGVEFPFYSRPRTLLVQRIPMVGGKTPRHRCDYRQQKIQGRYFDALRELSRRIAVIELVPYHSIAFKEHRLVRLLPSTARARDLVQSNLLKRAASGRVLVIAMRQVSAWGLDATKYPGIVRYATAQSRSASLRSTSLGGRAILERFGIEPS